MPWPTAQRAPIGIEVKGSDLVAIKQVGLNLERLVKQVPSVSPLTVLADRVVGKPYLEIVIDREVRDMVLQGAQRRIRPALMTSATTILALIPVLTSDGRGSDIMVPMAIPSFGGMIIAMLTVFVVPVLYCWVEEGRQESLSG